ncbi:MAG: hypothetical protein KIT24_11155 [Phycisphaeraceae bacterium]|nr:hypothetical protein [Phycisphaeraceae bacterium]
MAFGHGVRLKRCGVLARLGLTFMVLTLLGGAAASGFYLWLKQEKRDLHPGLTIDDIKAHYHGLQSRPRLLVALERGHPEELNAEDRRTLTTWMSGTPSEMEQAWADPDSIDLTPSEIIAASCVSCHTPDATGPKAYPQLNLRVGSFAAIQPLVTSVQIQPVSMTILALSTHTHALSLAVLAMVLWGLTLMTRWPGLVSGALLAVMGIGLAVDIGSWWLARDHAAWAWGIAIGGAAFNGAVGLSGLMILLDLWLPGGRGKSASA